MEIYHFAFAWSFLCSNKLQQMILLFRSGKLLKNWTTERNWPLQRYGFNSLFTFRLLPFHPVPSAYLCIRICIYICWESLRVFSLRSFSQSQFRFVLWEITLALWSTTNSKLFGASVENQSKAAAHCFMKFIFPLGFESFALPFLILLVLLFLLLFHSCFSCFSFRWLFFHFFVSFFLLIFMLAYLTRSKH